jgi:hypothetical protein
VTGEKLKENYHVDGQMIFPTVTARVACNDGAPALQQPIGSSG